MSSKRTASQLSGSEEEAGLGKDEPKIKKAKEDLGGIKDGEDIYWELSKNRRVTISKFNGKTVVSIREVYEKDGKTLPGKKGITLTLEQFASLTDIVPKVDATLEQQGESVPKPKAAEPKATKPKKPNFEATTDDEE